MGMQTGGKPPVWAAILLAAKEWGTPPWIIAEDDDPGAKTKWFLRWAEYTRWNNEAEKAAQRRAARRSNR